LSIGATLACLITGVYAVSSRIILRSYSDLEQREMVRNVQRVSDALDQMVADQHDKSDDWSTWDDTYKFMVDKNQGYIKSNLSTVTITLDLMLFLDAKGNVFYERPVDRVRGLKPPTGAEVCRALRFNRPTAQLPGHGKPFSGILQIPGRPLLLVSVRPVLKTSGAGPPHGWLLFGLYLDPGQVDGLSHRTHLTTKIEDMRHTMDSGDGRYAVSHLMTGGEVFTKPLNDRSVAGYAFLRDIYGHPIRLLTVTEPRDIYQQGVSSVHYLLEIMVLASVVFSVVFLVVLEVAALSRVSKLSAQVERIGDGEDRIYLPGNDELSWLAEKINGMLGNLITSNDELEIIVRQLESTNSALENAVEGISRLDLDGRFVAANSAFARSFDYTAAEMKGMLWEETIQPEDRENFAAAIEAMFETGKAKIEAQGRRRDGSAFYLETVLAAFYDDLHNLVGYYFFTKDISERRQLETQIEHQAFHDALTDLPNRALFMNRLAHAQIRAKRHQQSVAVIFCDLDNFKIINDSLGHEAGDELLVEVAERLKECVRPEDTVARLGGDEFTVLLEELSSPEEAMAVANRIVMGLATPITLPHGEAFASASIGIAYSICGVDMPESLLRDADTAMYQAKARGKCGYVLFDASMNEKAVERLELEVGLRQALEKGELYLEYQPVVNLRNAKVVGMEALLRWNHPTRGLVPPSVFIPVAEETGLIAMIGSWVLREACRQTRAWQDLFPAFPLVVSVNISGKQLQRTDINEQVSAALAESGLEAPFLKLEITESVLVTDMEEAVARLQRLRDLGVKLAIDDFGTGYSSMSTLSSFPVDTIKIDGSFTSRLVEESEAAAVIAAIIMLSKSMKLEITAEGLENEDQLMLLIAMGCNSAQGYYFARPLSVTDFSSRLSAGFTFSQAAA